MRLFYLCFLSVRSVRLKFHSARLLKNLKLESRPNPGRSIDKGCQAWLMECSLCPRLGCLRFFFSFFFFTRLSSTHHKAVEINHNNNNKKKNIGSLCLYEARARDPRGASCWLRNAAPATFRNGLRPAYLHLQYYGRLCNSVPVKNNNNNKKHAKSVNNDEQATKFLIESIIIIIRRSFACHL